MNDVELFTLLRSILLAGFAERGMGTWEVKQNFQQDQQGANTAPTVYLHKVKGTNAGSPKRKYTWDEVNNRTISEQSQMVIARFQATVLLDVDPADLAALTPSDGINIVTAIMQGDAGLEALRAQDVGLLRVVEDSNPFNVNDRGQFAAEPSIDLLLTYARGYTTVTPTAETVETRITRV